MANLLLGIGANSPRTFDHTRGDVVQLIEVTYPGYSKRSLVTEQFVAEYIANDFRELTEGNAAQTTNEPTETLKFFYSGREGEYDGSMIPIPLSRLLFEKIAPYARIPSTYLDVLFRNTAMNVYTTPRIAPQTPQTSPSQVRRSNLSFIIQSIPGAQRGVCAGTSFTYDFTTRHMYVFMHCLNDPRSIDFSTAIEQGAAHASPFLIPSLLAQFSLEERLRSINQSHDDVYMFERRLGIRYGHTELVDMSKMDFNGLTKGLNAVTTDLSYLVWMCKHTTRLLAFLDDVAGKYLEMAILNGINGEEAENIKTMLLETHAHLRCWNESLEERAEYLSKRGQALVQTVYSAIAQRDAALSQNAAIASARDSAVMRIIAAITVFFLPATTIATFFSTSFFDFNVGRNEKVYSWWLWLYWVVTIALTAIVIVGAILWWRKKEAEMATRISKFDGQSWTEKRRKEDSSIRNYLKA